MSTRTISPAGDPFTSSEAVGQDHPHACLDGYVYIGHLVVGDDGEEVEVIEALPCRRCADSR